jgi:hypothetical protein
VLCFYHDLHLKEGQVDDDDTLMAFELQQPRPDATYAPTAQPSSSPTALPTAQPTSEACGDVKLISQGLMVSSCNDTNKGDGGGGVVLLDNPDSAEFPVNIVSPVVDVVRDGSGGGGDGGVFTFVLPVDTASKAKLEKQIVEQGNGCAKATVTCAWLDEAVGVWREDGCEAVAVGAGSDDVECRCTRESSFCFHS